MKSGAALNGAMRDKLGQDTRRLVMLWIVVTGLWTAATLLRVNRIWAPGTGWAHILSEPWIWLSLGVPPAVFALLLFYLRQVIGFRRRMGR